MKKINIFLIFLSILFTILVKVVDVSLVSGTTVGFSTINQFVFENIGVNMVWYDITNCLGIISIFIAFTYFLIGFIQLIKRKSLFKVDREIILLGLFYIVIFLVYIFFENVIINYRPILLDGLESSYPSSHTLIAICICGSSIIINKKLFNNKFNIILLVIAIVMPIGRLMSGVHWFTDIIGGVIISGALLTTFSNIINLK